MNLETALAAFLLAKEAAHLSHATLDFYSRNCGAFVDWLSGARPRRDDWCQPATIRRFLASERRRGLSAFSVHARYRALRAWFNWLVAQGLLASSPVADVEEPKRPKQTPDQASLRDVQRLIAAIPDTDDWTDIRDRVVLGLMFWTGLRLGEMVGLSVADVHIEERILHVRDGKGGKDRLVPFPSEFGPLVLRYLMARPSWPGPALFVSNDGAGGIRGVLTRDGLRSMLKRRCALAGIRYRKPHSFRHGFAMAMLNNGRMEIEMVSKLLGHADVRTTQAIYADWVSDSLRREYDEAIRNMKRSQSG